MLKKLVKYYLYSFLLVDSLSGYLQRIIGIEEIHPSIVIRSALFAILLVYFIRNLSNENISKYIISILFAFIFIYTFIFLYYGFFAFLNDFKYSSKIIFMFLLIFYVYKNYNYFSQYINKIIIFNLIIFSSFVIGGYYLGFGVQHQRGMVAYRGYFYGGNPTSILSLIFFTYFLFNIKNLLYLILTIASAFSIYVIGTKAIIAIPFIFIAYLVYFNKRYKGFSKIIILYLASLIVLVIISGKAVNITKDIFYSRYQTEFTPYLKIFKSSEQSNIRRFNQAKLQLDKLTNEPQFALLGFSEFEQIKYYKTNSSMDFIDILYQYGLIGLTVLSIPFIKILWKSYKHKLYDSSFLIILIFLFYAFWGGHVLMVPTSNTLLSIFSAKKLYDIKIKGSSDFLVGKS